MILNIADSYTKISKLFGLSHSSQSVPMMTIFLLQCIPIFYALYSVDYVDMCFLLL